MTRTTPSRWITLHLSQIFLTDARTFIDHLRFRPAQPLLTSIKTFTIRPRVGSAADSSTSTRSRGRSRTKFRLAGRAARCASTCRPVGQLHPVDHAGQNLDDYRNHRCHRLRAAFRPHGLVSTHGPFSVTATQCSKCAAVGPVLRHRRPAVAQNLRFRPAGVHHRLDRQHHAFFQPRILVLPVHVIRNLRLLVQLRPDAVSHILPHHRKPVRRHVPLHRPAHVEQPVAGRTCSIASSSDSSVTSSSFCTSSLTSPTGNRDGRIAEVAVQLHAGVDRNDVARPSAPALPTASRARSRRSPRCTARTGTSSPAAGT